MLEPGCWIDSKRFGRAVLVTCVGGIFRLRYKATHNGTGQTLWIANTDQEVTFVSPPDCMSRLVLSLDGPYGLGPNRSDPRMPQTKDTNDE